MTTAPRLRTSRRSAMALLGGTAAVILASRSVPALALSTACATIGDAAIEIAFDDLMTSQISVPGQSALTGFSTGEFLRLADGGRIERFVMTEHAVRPLVDPVHGQGRELTVSGRASQGVEKTVRVRLFDRHPGFALINAAFRNVGERPLAVAGWAAASHLLPHAPGADAAWTFAGASYADRRDWVQPVIPGFDQRNFMGMNSSDYGGGTPCAAAWRRDAGLAVGHVETVPRLVALPVAASAQGTRLGVEGDVALVAGELPQWLPGATLETPELFLTAYRGDCFVPLQRYAGVMAERGMVPGKPNDACFEPEWCSWGYERQMTVDQVIGTLPKVREMGLTWAVLDDGWQTAEGDWYLDPGKFPGGDADMKRLVAEVRKAGLKPKLWIAPLAVDPGTDLLHEHSDMLLLGADGAVQDVTWWNAFYLCPAYARTLEHSKALVAKAFGDWGFAGLKIDGQHLNGVAPCHNPAHQHARPEESIEGLQRYWQTLYDLALSFDPQAVIELCPCGTSYAFHNMIGHNQSVASDPLSSWQIRHKGKVIRAVGGAETAFSGDHVELSDGGDDFASTVGIGAVPFTKFTWPTDPKPKDSFLLTAEREAEWRKWIDLYKAKMLSRGDYRGELYDIGFDRPEAHAIAKDGRMHYCFYAKSHDGPIELRGLPAGEHRVSDLWSNRVLGMVSAAQPRLDVAFERFLFVEAVPIGGAA